MSLLNQTKQSLNSQTTSDIPQTSKPTSNPKAITIGTQTDCVSNIGQGLKPLNPNIVKKPFYQVTLENSPDYLLNLHKVLGESFIAEAIKNDTNSNKIRRLIELQDWNAIKRFSKYWYSLRKDLSVTPNGCILYDGKMYVSYANRLSTPYTKRTQAKRA